MAVTIKDVAKRAGVSVITVSRVINGTSYVHTDTRARVLAAIEELQYVPNQMASSLRSQQSDTLALILPDITNSFWTTIARGVEDEAWSHGYGVFLCNTDDHLEKQARYLDILLRRRVAGIAIVPTPGSGPLLRQLQQRQTRFVMLHRKIEGVAADCVRSDSRAAVFALTRHLLDDGWRRIGYVGGSRELALSRDRLAGYEEALHLAGIALDPALVRIGEYGQQMGYRHTRELLRLDARPEALVIANSRLALGGLRAIAEAGLRPGSDIAVAAFHDISALDDYAPFLTTATQPAYEIGQLGVRRLLRQIAGEPTTPEDIVLGNRISVRSQQPEETVRSA